MQEKGLVPCKGVERERKEWWSGLSFIDVIFTNNVIQSTCREVYTNQNGLVGKYHIEICRRSDFQQTHRQKMLATAVLRQGQKNKEI